MTNKPSLDIKDLVIACDADGSTRVIIEGYCNSTDDIDDIVAWLALARNVVEQWAEIRADRD